MKRLLSLGIALSMMFAMLTGCSETTEEETTETTTETTEDGYTIGYVASSINDTFLNIVLDAAQDTVEAAGHEFLVADGQDDVLKQQDNVIAFIEQGVDALMVVAVETTAIGPMVEAASEAGIPLIFVNRDPFSGDESAVPENVYYVGSKEIEAGIFQAEYVAELLGGTGNVAVLQGMLGHEAQVKRSQGVLETIANYPDMEVVAEQTGNWQRDQGLSVTENFIAKFGDELDAVIANNDEMAIGASNALIAAGMEDVLVLGVDATPDAVAAVKDGTLTATVFQDAEGQGGGAAEKIIQVLDGENPEVVTWVPFELVTPENVDEFSQ